MEFEKVIEIKEKLQEELFIANSFGDKLRKIPTGELQNILILIDEFESEYYQLKQNLGQCENGYKLELHTARYQLYSANEALKKAQDRISELESENKRLKEGKFIIIRK